MAPCPGAGQVSRLQVGHRPGGESAVVGRLGCARDLFSFIAICRLGRLSIAIMQAGCSSRNDVLGLAHRWVGVSEEH